MNATVSYLTRQLEQHMTPLEARLTISALEHDDVLDTSPAHWPRLLLLALETAGKVEYRVEEVPQIKKG